MNFFKSISLAGLLLFVLQVADADQTVRITNGEWKPFLSESGHQHGFTSHIITEAFAAEGYTVEYSFFPWARAYEEAKKGYYDAAAAWLDGEDRRENFYLTDPISEIAYHFFHLKSYDFDWETLEDLNGLKIGATIEYTYTPEFVSAGKNKDLDVEFVATDELNLKKLQKGRIQIFPGEAVVTYGQLRSLFGQQDIELYTHHPKPLVVSSLHLLISKKVEGAKELQEVFNRGLDTIKNNGKFDQIMSDAIAGLYD